MSRGEGGGIAAEESKNKIKTEVLGGVVRVDEIIATIVIIIVEGRVQFCSGYVHGGSIMEEVPVYAQEAGVLHALRACKEWIGQKDQSTIKWIEFRVGNALVCNRIREWMRVGKCTLESPAASGLVTDIQKLQDWLEVDIFMRPFWQPAELAQGDGNNPSDPNAELFVRLAEHFRSVVIPQQGEVWREKLPRVPLSTNELKEVLLIQENRDEREALERLAEKGSTSAEIIKCLGLTRELAREVFWVLRGKRKLQVNLARILGAARFKVLTLGKVYHVKCPKTHCFERDSFQHMLQCYGIAEQMVSGADAVPFLVKMARATLPVEGAKLIPYMVEYYPDNSSGHGGDGDETLEGEQDTRRGV